MLCDDKYAKVATDQVEIFDAAALLATWPPDLLIVDAAAVDREKNDILLSLAVIFISLITKLPNSYELCTLLVPTVTATIATDSPIHGI